MVRDYAISNIAVLHCQDGYWELHREQVSAGVSGDEK